MQKIRISTDSTADIPKSLRDELNIKVLPISLVTSQREYQDGYDIEPEEFYSILEQEEQVPSTAQVSMAVYSDLFEETLNQGYTDLIYISINSKGSGSFQTAVLSKNLFFEEHPEAIGKLRIHLMDSLNYSLTYGWAAIEAARMAAAGVDIEKILVKTQDWLMHAKALLVPLDLHFVKKSGRVSAAAAFVGDAMGLKPAITFVDGKSKVLTKIRGEKKLPQAISDLVNEDREPNSPYFLAYTANMEAFDRMKEVFDEKMDRPAEFNFPLGCVIATNAGPNSIAVVYRTK
ncbi:MAG: DegV family protein [Oscillospiraceae bacterium]|nr:DegV family protein [Oscillospiraceae bacterium]